MPYLGIFGQEVKKPLVLIEISTLKFIYLQNFTKKEKCLNLASKMSYLGIIELEF